MRFLLRAAALATLFLSAVLPASAQFRSSDDRPGDFDFYVLALSWSPSYCEAEGSDAEPGQCNAVKPFGFVVHGLWPQYERGSPRSCDAAERDVPRSLARSLLDIMPSTSLIRHEWRTHGTCSGLAQTDYFALLRRAFQRVTIPAPFRNLQGARSLDPRQIEQSFVRANPGLTPDALAVDCDGNLLREVRICMDKELRFRACAEVDRRSCRQRLVRMPPMRGN